MSSDNAVRAPALAAKCASWTSSFFGLAQDDSIGASSRRLMLQMIPRPARSRWWCSPVYRPSRSEWATSPSTASRERRLDRAADLRHPRRQERRRDRAEGHPRAEFDHATPVASLERRRVGQPRRRGLLGGLGDVRDQGLGVLDRPRPGDRRDGRPMLGTGRHTAPVIPLVVVGRVAAVAFRILLGGEGLLLIELDLRRPGGKAPRVRRGDPWPALRRCDRSGRRCGEGPAEARPLGCTSARRPGGRSATRRDDDD